MGCDQAAGTTSHGQGSGTCNGGGFSYDVPNQLILSARAIFPGIRDGGDGASARTAVRLTSGDKGWTAGVGPITFDSVCKDLDALSARFFIN